ncbi:hypothetical protein [Streptomyces chryseus]|uniref:hypothetical protein n=1 Tax=Streptomyces chryseus TaxID=68186 RepID=UPI00110FC543|nr:hypothetical protein [Streptomyces chryseus]GGX36704.1 hypothetical protein GCM10010353_59830 [Streptomyces chryseus]
MTRRQYVQNGLPVPYIAAWSNERKHTPILRRREGPDGPYLAYRDETVHDRDMYGALWVRQGIARGKGRADFAAVHPLRQRQAAVRLLCQVCGTDTLTQTPDQQLFVMRDTGQPITEGETTDAPPVCVPCAHTAVRNCPRLRARHVAAWVASPQVWGVSGVAHHPQTLRPLAASAQRPTVEVSYDDPHIGWVIASRHLSILRGVTPVNLSDLSATEPSRPTRHP